MVRRCYPRDSGLVFSNYFLPCLNSFIMNSQTKLKHIRDFAQNCKEVEQDFNWFVFRFWPLVMISVVGLIYMVAYFADEIDTAFKSLAP